MSENEFSIASPCINVCRLNKDRVCEGCLRTRDEIVEWRASHDVRRREILTNIRDRKAAIK